jgi:hypothetical protein
MVATDVRSHTLRHHGDERPRLLLRRSCEEVRSAKRDALAVDVLVVRLATLLKFLGSH